MLQEEKQELEMKLQAAVRTTATLQSRPIRNNADHHFAAPVVNRDVDFLVNDIRERVNQLSKDNDNIMSIFTNH